MMLFVLSDSIHGSRPGSSSAVSRPSGHAAHRRRPSNEEIATLLDRVADLLEVQHASVHRVRAYRAAGQTLRTLEGAVVDRVSASGAEALESLPAIGKSIAALIRELVSTGRLALLERLTGQISPQDLFSTVPGIGESLAARIESDLHVETLEDLEAAASDGRLESVPGFGPSRVRAVRDSLGNLLRFSAARRARETRPRATAATDPPIELLIETDRCYLDRADRGELRMIAPRRFNPEHRSWLPVLHREGNGWSLTAMFSNTARAHQLDRTGDWVVIYYERDGDEGQCTVVSEHRGPLAGKRVVRGREVECELHYASSSEAVAAPD
jgi:hypothetical protein